MVAMFRGAGTTTTKAAFQLAEAAGTAHPFSSLLPGKAADWVAPLQVPLKHDGGGGSECEQQDGQSCHPGDCNS